MEDDKKTKSIYDPTRNTLGQDFVDISGKKQDDVCVQDLRKEMEKKLIDNFDLAVERGKKKIKGDFFVQMCNKREKMFPVFTTHHQPRKTCPKPFYDQAVYKYISADDRVVLLWALPSRPRCKTIRAFPLACPKEQERMRQDVLDYYDGTLMRMYFDFNKGDVKPNIIL